MSTNNKLAMAVAAALFSISAADTVFADIVNLTNVSELTGLAVEGSDGGTVPVANDFAVATSDDDPAEDGITYAAELFGESPSALPSGAYAGAIYTTDGAIDEDFFLTFSLSGGATFGDTVELFTDANTSALDTGSLPTGVTPDNSEIKFNIKVVDGEKIEGTSRFLLKYKLTNTAAALATAGGKITMNVSPTSVGQTQYLVNVSDDVTVAQSSQAVEIEINSVEFNNSKIATSLGGTEFVNTITTESDATYIATNQVWLGSIVVTHDNTAMNDDAETPFILGSAGGEIADAKIVISDGQFAASITDPGGIKLIDADSDAELGATVELTEDGTGVTIDITDIVADMSDIEDVEDSDYIKNTNIMLVVDGVTEINIPENEPCASLTIDYDDSNIADVAVPDDGSCKTLPKIQQDGTVCWVNIIPKADAVNDRLSILITNNGVAEDELVGTMYAQDGTVLFTSQVLTDSAGTTVLGAGKTMRLTPASLGALMDGSDADNPGTWVGRSVLKIVTAVPDIEILALIRDVNSNINSNVSQGAAGASCTSN